MIPAPTIFGRRLEKRGDQYWACVGQFDVGIAHVNHVCENGVGGFVVVFHHPLTPIQIAARPTLEDAIAHAESVVRLYHSTLGEILEDAAQ